MRDGVFNYSSVLVAGLVGIILVPIMLKGLGAESYGLWIAVLAVAAVPAGFDFGLGASVTREVAASLGDEARNKAAPFIRAAGNAYVVLGLFGALAIGTLGVPLSRNLHLSAAGQKIAPTVFLLIGLSFLTDQVLSFVLGVLRGLRRFDVANLILNASIFLRAAGIAALVEAGAAVVPVAAWYTLISVLIALAGLGVVGRLVPRFRLRVAGVQWSSLRGHFEFAFTSLLATAAIKIIWGLGAVLIGVILGSAWVVPFHIGEKFPLAVAGITWRMAEVLFPAASEHERAQNMEGTREVLEVGTRWIFILALPLCLVLWIVGPNLLRAWVGEVRPDTLQILRLVTLAVLADAVGVGAMYVLWGRGRARDVLVILGSMAVAIFGFSLWFLTRLGIVGLAWGMVFPMVFGSLAFLYMASRACGIASLELMRGIGRGLLLPAVACGATTLGIVHLALPGRWTEVLGATLAGGAAYAGILYLGGAREEERRLIHAAVTLPAAVSRSAYRGIRYALRRAGYLSS